MDLPLPSTLEPPAKASSAHPGFDPAEPRDRLILALDFPSGPRALTFLSDLQLRSEHPPKWVKVGLELFLAEGVNLVHTLRDQGYSVFLDLKLHDIPNTVASAIRSLAPLQPDLLTIHGAGGPAMLRAAAEAAAALPHPPRLLAVTVLTSMNAAELNTIGVAATPAAQVLRLATVAAAAGVHGLVASPLEAAMLRTQLPAANLHLVTPGIRPAADSSQNHTQDDQQRIATPAAALHAGASQLVIGRPITQAPDPALAYTAILAEVRTALS